MKYEHTKYLKRVKARISHGCRNCGSPINVGDFYYKECIDVMKPPNLVLKDYCEPCGTQQTLTGLRKRD